MAETNMKELIAEVKKTNILLNKNVEHTEPEPVGADRAIKEEQARDARSAMSETFSKFLGSGSFVGKALGGLGDKLKGFGSTAKGALGTLAIAAGLGALSKFLQSDLFQKLKDTIIPALATALEAVGDALTWIYENILKPLYLYLEENLPKVIQTFSDFFTWLGPKITFLYDEYLSPILGIFQTAFIDTWANIKTLFEDLGESFKSFEEDGLFATIANVFLDIGRFVGEQIDITTTALYNTIATVFGLEETDSVFGSIKGFFSDIYDTTTTWVSDTFQAIKDAIFGSFTWVADKTMEGSTWLSDLVTGVYDDIKAFFWQTLSWTSASLLAGIDWLSDLVTGVYEDIKAFFTDAFTWVSDTTTEGVDFLTNLVTDQLTAIKEFFTDAFTFVKGVGGVYAFTLYDTVTAGLEDAWDAVKTLFSTDGLTIENLTNLFGSLFDVVTAPIKAAFEAIRSIFSPMDATETEKLKSDYSIFGLLKGIVEDVFNWFKNDIFSFDFDTIKIPEFPNIGEIITDIFRKFALSIANVGFNIPLVGRVEFRSVLPQTFLDFADQTGQYAPPKPSRPAENYGPTNSFGERGRGETPIVISQSSVNTRAGDQFQIAASIMPGEPGLRDLVDAV